MGRSCSVCSHPESFVINEAIVLEKRSNRVVARQFGLHHDAVRRHREHIPKLLVEASRAMDAYEADDLLGRVEDLHRRTLAVLEAAEETGELRTALAAIREARGNLELVGRITKELDDRPQVNLYLSPEWIELRGLIVAALQPHTEARESVLRAIGRAEAGGTEAPKRLHAAPEWP